MALMESTSKRSISPGAEKILGLYFPVLDHGFVSLVDYMGTDEDIERAARVSYGHGTRKTSETRGLLRYLKRHKHTTPSEMVELKFHCCMPIFVARQWIRHRTANVNEMSGRYSLLPMLFYTPEKEQMRTQSLTNKQGRSETHLSDADYVSAIELWESERRTIAANYEWLSEANLARELARIDLPLSTYTQWYWKIDLHNLQHFLTLRVDSHAQWETRAYGEIMAGMFQQVAPLAYEAWIDYSVCGSSFSRAEMQVLRHFVHVDESGSIAARPYSRSFNELELLAGPTEFGEVADLSKREVVELRAKLQLRQTPSFNLDLTKAKPPEYFREMMEKAVPKEEKAPQ